MYSKIMTSKKYEYNKNDNYEIDKYLKNIALGSTDDLINLYNNTKHIVYGYAISILKNVHEAEDILHDVYIKIFENAEMYQSSGKPMAWILTITRNLSLMKIRKEKHHEDIDELIETIALKSNMDDIENKILIDTVFKHISDEERNILILHVLSGYKFNEISKFLALPLSTALSKYHRVIKKMKKLMKEEKGK